MTMSISIRKIAGMVAVLGCIVCGNGWSAVASKQVVILYDQGQDRREPALTDARYLGNLCGHFNTAVRIMPVASYTSGAMNGADAVFYISYEKQFRLPEAFKADFYRFGRTFCWINHQIGQLDQNYLRSNYGFHHRESREDLGFNSVTYQGVQFPKGDENVEIVGIDNAAVARTVAVARNDAGQTVPYILHAKNLWFVADSPFSYATERDRYIAFADVLHDILKEDHAPRHSALVRIEDINPKSDPAALLRIARYLHSKNVPFAVGVSPVYIDAGERVELHLEDTPKLLSALRKIPRLGGTIVLHGYTHQYHGTTTDDYEFWDDIADKPIRGDSVNNASLRIEKSLKEFFDADLYPLAWETPHYFASANTYAAVKRHFTLAFERRGTMGHLGTDQFFPYEVRDMYGQFVIPENLGYVPVDKQDSLPIIEAARLNLAVRDGYASFFFHPFVEMGHLKKIVKALRGMGYEFRDIKEFDPSVAVRDKAAVCGRRNVRVETGDRFIFVREYNRWGGKTREQVMDNTGKPMTFEVTAPRGGYAVVKPQDEREPGLVAKIWHLAKTDLRYLRTIRQRRPGGMINAVMSVGFVVPRSAPRAGDEAHDLNSLKFSLSIAGVKFKEIVADDIPGQDLREYDILVVPAAAAKTLKADAVARIKEAVRSGSGIVFDGQSRLNDELDVPLSEKSITVRRVRDYQFPEIPLYWPEAAEVRPVYQSADNHFRIFCVDEESNAPLVVGGKYGNGTFVYCSTYFDPHTDRGYTRFPFLLETMGTAFNYQPLAGRRTAEMYFDPGLRQFISIEKLARLWRRNGVRTVYAGGWHFYDKYTYDYARLIRVCHQEGILVYCWLEPPMVNQKFWNKHPEWREKTALLKDGAVSWRYLMNLADPRCRKKVFEETEDLLLKYDWDGANVAELYFESVEGPARPDIFTPMNRVVRADFKKKSGFDPIDLFKADSPYFWKTNDGAWQQFAVYRRDLCTRLKDDYMGLLARVRAKKKDFEIVFTVIDTTFSDRLESYLGEDMSRNLELQKKYGLTFQVEDASPFWSGKPERYAQLGEHYRRFIKGSSRLQLDCNVLGNHPKGSGGLPAEKPTGEEMRQITYNMSLNGCTPVFYSEESINEHDFRNITAVLARDAAVTREGENQWRVSTPSMVTVHTGKKDLLLRLDDEPWFAVNGGDVIVPAGNHVLRFEQEPRYFDMTSLKPRLTYISSDLKWANFFTNAIEFAYDAGPSPCFVIVSKRPGRIIVDDKRISANVEDGENGFAVKLPSGSHSVRMNVGGGIAHLVETSGVVLFSLIIIFGFFASILFIGLFVLIQVKRKIQS
jgi:uncharacterized protein YdaL